MTMLEEWRDVVGHEGSYQVSNLGRVKSLIRGSGVTGSERILSTPLTASGYPRVGLGPAGARRKHLVHTLVAAAFIGPRPDGHEVRHLNGIASDVTVTNLAYGTHSTNTLDQVAHGTHPHARKTACPRGHPYTRRGSRRVCLECNVLYTARYRAKLKALKSNG